MPEVPTFDELYGAGQAEVQARNPDLTDFNEGSDLDAVNGGASVLADAMMALVIDLFADQFVDTAEGDALDTLAADRFGLTRNAASASVGVLELGRGDEAGAFTVPSGTTISGTVNGQTVSVTTTAAASFAAGDDTIEANAQADQTGRQGNVAAGVLTTVVNPPAGHPTITATNPERFAGGAAEESDAAFRDRIRRYFQTLRKGTVAALEAGALDVAGVSYATVDESTAPWDEGGYVSVYVGDPEGAGNATLASLVETALEDWRAAGIEVRAFGSEREEISLSLTVTVRRGADTDAIETAIRAAVLGGYVDTLAPNETLYASQCERRALNVSDDVRHVVQTTPGDQATDPTDPYKALRVLDADLGITFVVES